MGICCFGTCVGSSTSPSKSTTPTTTTATPNGSNPGGSGMSSSNNGKMHSDGKGLLPTPKLKLFTYAELKTATSNFKPDSLLGEGGFGKVYKGCVDEKTLTPTKAGVGINVAVKRLNPIGIQGFEEWKSEVDFLGMLSHPNLVKLLGCCWEDRELLLVYEMMSKGSLENHLFRRSHSFQPLPWDLRLKIAIDVAQGLAFLHTSDKKIIYRDFKTANILLDSDFNAKLSDFGLAKNGPNGEKSHVSTRVMGSMGYAAPEYISTGHLYVQSDVYGFGVVLLEMLSGRRVHDVNRLDGQEYLVDWAKPLLRDPKKITTMFMDSTLKNQYNPKAAYEIAQLVLSCITTAHKTRPSMKEVLSSLKSIRLMEKKPPPSTKPVSTAHHAKIYKHQLPSWRMK